MAAKSRYQLINRGRPGKPAWYCTNSVTGGNSFVSRIKSKADSELALRREYEPQEREREARLAAGYHLPGL